MSTSKKRKSLQEDNDEYELSRILLLSDDVTQEYVGELILSILEINQEDNLSQLENPDYVREPISLIINSSGGSVYDGLALIDCMDESKTPIYTICYGSAMSMAMMILICGHVRYAGKYSTIMYHGTTYSADGKVETHKQELKEIERLDKICDEILLARTKLTKRIINKKMTGISEWYITAEECLKLQIIDAIL